MWEQVRTGNSRIFTRQPILFRLFGVLVEQARITNAALDRRHVRRVNVLLGQTLPRHLGKPRVVHDITAATVQVAQTLGQVVCDEFGEQVLRVWVNVRRVLDAALEDVFVNLQRRAGIPEGCETAKHFEDENAERPPVR
jgi:hypothetical protein